MRSYRAALFGKVIAVAATAKSGEGIASPDILERFYRLFLGVAVTGLFFLAAIAAGREYSFAGAVLVFSLLVYFLGAVLASNRYVLCTALALTILLLAVDRIDQVKYEHLQSHLNPYDLLVVSSMLAHADLTVVSLYFHLVWPFLLALCIAGCVLAFTYSFEKRIVGSYQGLHKIRHVLFVTFLALFTIQLTIFCKSRYLDNISRFHSYLTSAEPGGLRIGSAVNFVWRMVQTWSELSTKPELTQKIFGGSRERSNAATGNISCSSCPDLIFIHLESTFDPVLLEEYSHSPGYLDKMAVDGEQRSRSGPLLVNIYGGSSWISEFELLCGVRHTKFGEAGLYPHMFVSPYVKGCVPAFLKSLGYRTEAIYTTHPFFAGVAAGFRNYGIDKFLDSKSVGAPVDWRQQRDIHFIDALRKRLAEPSSQPRFIFVSTNSNHGPHGRQFARINQPGPFDPSRALSGEVSDYIERLNATYTTMLQLERDLIASGRPVAVLFYGDHQPAYRKTYAASARQRFKRDISNITVFRMMRTYGDAPSHPVIEQTPIRLEDLASSFLEFAGISPSH